MVEEDDGNEATGSAELDSKLEDVDISTVEDEVDSEDCSEEDETSDELVVISDDDELGEVVGIRVTSEIEVENEDIVVDGCVKLSLDVEAALEESVLVSVVLEVSVETGSTTDVVENVAVTADENSRLELNEDRLVVVDDAAGTNE